MTVDDMTFLVDRLHADCARGQYIRELTKNSIQACEDLLQTGKVEKAAISWDFQERDRVRKLVLTDTGVGMTGPEMVDHINRLSASGRRQGNAYNYGVGAKIAALPLNRRGLVYVSKKYEEPEGALVHLWFDPVAKKYGVVQQRDQKGVYSQWLKVPAAKLPKTIRDHGTQVILLGNSDDQDTTEQPDGLTGRKRWLFKYLVSRFYRLPRGVEIKVAVEREEGGRADPRRVYGLEHWLRENSASHGLVRLAGAGVHWFILREGTDASSGIYPNLGIVAALWQDELYELATGATASSRMVAFGVVFEMKRVVLIVEPDPDKHASLTSDTARARLLVDGGSLPWADWAREFRERFPQELDELQQDASSKASAGDVRQNIVERLRLNLDLFKLSRYRRTLLRSDRADPESADDATGESGPEDSGDRSESGPSSTRPRGASRSRAERPNKFYSDLLSDDVGGVVVEQVEVTEKIPEVQFISLENGTREEGALEDRAARYVSSQNLLQVNEDFRIFADMRTRWERAYPGLEGAKFFVKERVREWFSQQLVETVMTGRALAGTSKYWTEADVEEKLFTEEALTASILPRYHVDKQIKREMGSKFGRSTDEPILPE
jgi:hypothetical protein